MQTNYFIFYLFSFALENYYFNLWWTECVKSREWGNTSHPNEGGWGDHLYIYRMGLVHMEANQVYKASNYSYIWKQVWFGIVDWLGCKTYVQDM